MSDIDIKIDIENLLTHTETLMNHIYWVKQDFKLRPIKEHIASTINWTDVTERRHDFIKELINTVSSWVYSKAKAKDIIDKQIEARGGDLGNAASFLTTQAFSKFRPGKPQGQFGELLLFNFIQHFFKAVPLLRKQKITTSIGHERFGSDAIHYKQENGLHIIILGESKCYKSSYKFVEAFTKSLESISKSINELSTEMDLYVYDDFIEPELEKVAIKYKENTLYNIRIELVCVIVYNESEKETGQSEAEIKDSIISIIQKRCLKLDSKIYSYIEPRHLDRINYILFPIRQLDDLLNDFSNKVGA